MTEPHADRPSPLVRVEHGDAVTTVHDPAFGALHSPTDRFGAALAWPPGQLRDLLARYAPGLQPPADVAPVTLAALAAVRVPEAWAASTGAARTETRP